MLIDDQHKMNNAFNDETEADTNVNTSFDKVDTIVPKEVSILISLNFNTACHFIIRKWNQLLLLYTKDPVQRDGKHF